MFSICIRFTEVRILPLLLTISIKSFKKPTTKEEFKMLEKMKLEDLASYLHEFFKGHRYLVVFSDVWDVVVWESLKRAFPDNEKESIVIITIRTGVKLLKKIVVFPLNMKRMARYMVKKCCGLPSPIIILGRVLSRKILHEWPKVQ